MCRHIYDWNIVDCDFKQPIHTTLLTIIGDNSSVLCRLRRSLDKAHHEVPFPCLSECNAKGKFCTCAADGSSKRPIVFSMIFGSAHLYLIVRKGIRSYGTTVKMEVACRCFDGITNIHSSTLITIGMKEKTSIFLENYIEHKQQSWEQ